MTRRLVVVLAMVAGCLLVSSSSAFAQADSSALEHSVHAKLVCVACHTGLDPKSVPYRGKVEPVACQRCHADAMFKHAFHPEVAQAARSGATPKVTCKECHGTHDIESPKTAGTKFSAGRLAESCGKCHEKAAATYRASTHGKAMTDSVRGAPTCLSCHRQRITFPQAVPGGADSMPAKLAQVQVCQTCHLDSPDARERVAASTTLIPDWTAGAHGRKLEHGDAKAANCVSCHGSHGIEKRKDPGSLVGRDSVVGTCARCHGAEEKKFDLSVHGHARTSAQTDSMTCATCHGEHAKPAPAGTPVPSDPKIAMAQACTRCHAPVKLTGTYAVSSASFKSFADSRHGFAAHGGTIDAANCASCHTAHEVKPSKDSTSSVHEANRVAACGKCHTSSTGLFAGGPVHEKAVLASVGAIGASSDDPTDHSWRWPAGVLVVGLAGGLVFMGRRRKARA
jgi:hypothetical protein